MEDRRDEVVEEWGLMLHPGVHQGREVPQVVSEVPVPSHRDRLPSFVWCWLEEELEARISTAQEHRRISLVRRHLLFSRRWVLSTKAGCECVSHVVQALTEADPETTVVSFGGASAFDGSVARGRRRCSVPICTLSRQIVAVLVGGRHRHHSHRASGRGRGARRSLDALVVLSGSTQGTGGDQQRTVGVRKIARLLG